MLLQPIKQGSCENLSESFQKENQGKLERNYIPLHRFLEGLHPPDILEILSQKTENTELVLRIL